jgi:hypothetical protein
VPDFVPYVQGCNMVNAQGWPSRLLSSLLFQPTENTRIQGTTSTDSIEAPNVLDLLKFWEFYPSFEVDFRTANCEILNEVSLQSAESQDCLLWY